MEQFDNQGRMKYNKAYHPNQGKRFTEEDLEYMCKYFDTDGIKSIALALGRTEMTIGSNLSALKKNGKLEYYRKLNKHWG